MKVKTDHLIPTLAGLSELAEKMAEHKEALVELMEFLQAVHDTFEQAEVHHADILELADDAEEAADSAQNHA
jgi:hypothetical protein